MGRPFIDLKKIALSRAQNSHKVDPRRVFNLICQKCAGHMRILQNFTFSLLSSSNNVSTTSRAEI